jgi:predicted transcriptional regulator YheO
MSPTEKMVANKWEPHDFANFLEYYGQVTTKRSSSSRDEKKKDAEYIRQFIPFVKFLGEVLGSQTEVVLHDASQPDKSVVAIANGHVSGRTVGSPATDLMLKVMKDGISANKDYVVGYEGKTRQSKYNLLSSTYFIRRNNRIIGTLCINSDQTPLHALQQAVNLISQSYFPEAEKNSEDDSPQEENLIASVEDIATQVIAEMSTRTGVTPTKLSAEQRLTVIRELCDRGYFNFKGAIAKVAKQLNISESTAYRYLRMVQEE